MIISEHHYMLLPLGASKTVMGAVAVLDADDACQQVFRGRFVVASCLYQQTALAAQLHHHERLESMYRSTQCRQDDC
jgi:hypothetical protein